MGTESTSVLNTSQCSAYCTERGHQLVPPLPLRPSQLPPGHPKRDSYFAGGWLEVSTSTIEKGHQIIVPNVGRQLDPPAP